MAIVLTYGNVPPARGRIQLGEQIRNDDMSALIACLHEQWAASGEQFGGLLFDRASWETTLTSYNYGTTWPLDRWQPLCELAFRHNTATQAVIAWHAYVRNLDIQVEILNAAWVVQGTTSQTCTSNTPRWISQLAIAGSLNVSEARILRISARRSTFAADGELLHFGARSRPNAASQIPLGP